ncbi:hypothetical protein D3C86_2096120 [compost metagenome]
MYCVNSGIESAIICAWPPITSVSAGELPLYGIWTMNVPEACLNISGIRCEMPPLPPEAKFSLPGLALA